MVYGDYLGIVLLVYILPRTIVVVCFRKARAELRKGPTEKEVERFRRERQNNLTLSGFSLSALALFLALGTNPLNPSRPIDINDTTYYLSISLVCFVTAAYLYPFHLSRYYSYAADSLEQIGLLCVGAAMLLFFINNIEGIQRIHIVYWVFFVVIILIATKDSLNYFRMYRN